MQRTIAGHVACGLLLGCLGIGGCASRSTDEGSNGSESALRAGETERGLLASNIASIDPAATGVDAWRVALVHSDSEGFIWVVTGTKLGGSDAGVLEIVSTSTENYLRSPDESVALDIPEARATALASDLDNLSKVLATLVDAQSLHPKDLVHRRGTVLVGDPTLGDSVFTAPSLDGCAMNAVGSVLGAVATVVLGKSAGTRCDQGSVMVHHHTNVRNEILCERSSNAALRAAVATGDLLTALPAACAGIPSDD